MKLALERDYRINCEVYTGGRWKKDGALCVAKTGVGAIRRVKSRAFKGRRLRNCKATRLKTRHGRLIR
jgi:hypothetical protein